jgi:hypothetical protein
MANDLTPGDLGNLWRQQPVEPERMSKEELQRRMERLETKRRRARRFGMVIMLCCAMGYASFLYFFPGTLQRLGSSLTLVGYAYAMRNFRPGERSSRAMLDPLQPTLAGYRDALVKQRDFVRDAWKNFTLPFIPGPVLFITGFALPELGATRAIMLAVALMVAPLATGIPVCRMRASHIQREIDSLDAL